MAKKKNPPVYLKLQRLVDPATGAEVAAFVAADWNDRDELRARRYRIGELVRATLEKPRNPSMMRRAHGLAKLVSDNIDGYFEDRHETLKKLQRESKAECDIVVSRFAGCEVEATLPRSLSFDDMTEESFENFFKTVCLFISDTYWPDVPPHVVEEQARCMAAWGEVR